MLVGEGLKPVLLAVEFFLGVGELGQPVSADA